MVERKAKTIEKDRKVTVSSVGNASKSGAAKKENAVGRRNIKKIVDDEKNPSDKVPLKVADGGSKMASNAKVTKKSSVESVTNNKTKKTDSVAKSKRESNVKKTEIVVEEKVVLSKKQLETESGRLTSVRENKKNKNKNRLGYGKKASLYPVLTPESGLLVEQYRSTIRKPSKQRKQVESLGLGKIGNRRLLPKIPAIEKLVNNLKHLVRIVKK